jgi:hypothetical protein
MHISYYVKARRKETTRKTKHRWMDNIKMDLGDAGRCGKDWRDGGLLRIRRFFGT